MKVGDLLRLNEDLWLLLEVAEDLSDQSILIMSAKTGYRMWGDPRGFEVVSKCQENVKSGSDTLRQDSERVTL